MPRSEIIPWDPQPGETEKEFSLFKIYLEMDTPRSIPRVANETGVAISSVNSMAKRYYWKRRAIAWDRHLIEIETEEIVDEAMAAKRDHMRILARAREVAEHGLVLMQEQAAYLMALPEEVRRHEHLMKPKDLINMLKDIIQLERLIFGEVNARVEVQGWDLEKLTEQELDQLELLWAKQQEESN